jgi:hypothetical protein
MFEEGGRSARRLRPFGKAHDEHTIAIVIPARLTLAALDR